MRTKVLLGALIAVLAIGGTAIAHEVKFETKITAQYKKAQDLFTGRVTSDKDKCEVGRGVKVFQVEGSERTLVASGTTDEDGFYEITYDVTESGDYFVRAARSVLRRNDRHSHICAVDGSRTIAVTVPAAH